MIDYDPSRIALYSPEERDTVFVKGTRYSAEQLAAEGARLAYVKAEVSQAERLRLTEALARAEFDAPALFGDSNTGSEAFAALRRDDGTALVAFRGTQPGDVADLSTDLRANAVPWAESAGRVHAGFAAAARTLFPQVRGWIDQCKPDPNKMILRRRYLSEGRRRPGREPQRRFDRSRPPAWASGLYDPVRMADRLGARARPCRPCPNQLPQSALPVMIGS